MRVETLPSPGMLSQGIRLRNIAAQAISSVEINAGISVNGGKSSNAKPLADFFTACAESLGTMLDVIVPVIAAGSIAPSNPSELVLTYDEGLDARKVPDVGDFVIGYQVRTVTKVAIDGPFVLLTVNAPFTAGTVSVAYTQSATVSKRLQDISGNQADSFDIYTANGVM